MSDAEKMTASNSGSGQALNIRLIGFDKPFFTAFAVVASIFSCIYSFEAGREKAQDVYWKQRAEAFLEILATQGYKVPSGLLPHK